MRFKISSPETFECGRETRLRVVTLIGRSRFFDCKVSETTKRFIPGRNCLFIYMEDSHCIEIREVPGSSGNYSDRVSPDDHPREYMTARSASGFFPLLEHCERPADEHPGA